MNIIDFVPIFKALADETRLKIICMLSKGDLCACKILEHFNITQPTLSYHMKILCDSEIVKGTRNGAWMTYSLNKSLLGELKIFLADIELEESRNNPEDCCQ